MIFPWTRRGGVGVGEWFGDDSSPLHLLCALFLLLLHFCWLVTQSSPTLLRSHEQVPLSMEFPRQE